jgi:hypothetical protein
MKYKRFTQRSVVSNSGTYSKVNPRDAEPDAKEDADEAMHYCLNEKCAMQSN